LTELWASFHRPNVCYLWPWSGVNIELSRCISWDAEFLGHEIWEALTLRQEARIPLTGMVASLLIYPTNHACIMPLQSHLWQVH
jgi:hypothetical protein